VAKGRRSRISRDISKRARDAPPLLRSTHVSDFRISQISPQVYRFHQRVAHLTD